MHVKPIRYQDQRCLHFITFSCYRRLPLLDSSAAKQTFELTLERVRVWYGCYIAGYVLMPEHAHLLISEPERSNLSVAIQMLKQITSQKLRTSSHNGQREGENEWESCSWPEPTLPHRPREGWGNPRMEVGERMGQPPSGSTTGPIGYSSSDEAVCKKRQGDKRSKDANDQTKRIRCRHEPIRDFAQRITEAEIQHA
jgi:REP element-mobilizing transposase RayT